MLIPFAWPMPSLHVPYSRAIAIICLLCIPSSSLLIMLQVILPIDHNFIHVCACVCQKGLLIITWTKSFALKPTNAHLSDHLFLVSNGRRKICLQFHHLLPIAVASKAAENGLWIVMSHSVYLFHFIVSTLILSSTAFSLSTLSLPKLYFSYSRQTPAYAGYYCSQAKF